MPARIDLTGKQFGRWKVVRYAGPSAMCAKWLCKCECGNERELFSSSLISGRSRSCGCWVSGLVSSASTKHGHNRISGQSPTYKSWRAMLRRCTDKSHRNYAIYGGKGVAVCRRWLKFANFLADMGERPDGKTLDRIDGNKDYCKSNCRWSSPMEQANNMSVNRKLTYKGRTQNVAQWSRELGINANTIRVRLHKGWSIWKALGVPEKS